MAQNIPLTVESAMVENFGILVAYGQQSVQPPSLQPNQYWFVVFDRSSLNVVYNVASGDGTSVPNGLAQYNTDQYILVLTTYVLSIVNLPQGDLYDFLIDNGAGRQLNRLIQINNQIGCGQIGSLAYALVAVLGNVDQGFEASQIPQTIMINATTFGVTAGPGPILTLTLMPVVVGGQISWTPIDLAD